MARWSMPEDPASINQRRDPDSAHACTFAIVFARCSAGLGQADDGG
jgi:hypothetical protein